VMFNSPSRAVAVLFLLGLSAFCAFPAFLGVWLTVVASGREPFGVLVSVLEYVLCPLAVLFLGVMFEPLREHSYPIGFLRAVLPRHLVTGALRRVGLSESWRYLLFASLGVFAVGLVMLPFV